MPADQDAFTTAELLERLTAAIFRETEKLDGGKFTNRKPAISSLRRSLQRRYLERLADLAMGNTSAPDDCQTMAYTELEALEARIKQVLAGKAQLDTYTRAHLRRDGRPGSARCCDARVDGLPAAPSGAKRHADSAASRPGAFGHWAGIPNSAAWTRRFGRYGLVPARGTACRLPSTGGRSRETGYRRHSADEAQRRPRGAGTRSR